MKSTSLWAGLLLISGVALTGMAGAAGEHDGHAAGHDEHAAHAQTMFLEQRDINGYTVSFHVMEATAGMSHGGTHNLMIKVEQGGQVLGDIQANSKVIYPDGKDQSKPLQKMGDWYMAGYDLAASGKHQLMVLFKTSDGEKHFGGVYYPAN